ncbi:MAG TPA: acyl-ACP desaturase [Acidimicrobiales bacterium]|nr:acyl-ACP desaturase [Acidimicrobiales bacterium]
MNDATVLNDLAPTAEKLLERHMGVAKEWFPHDMVPWSLGRDFVEGEEVELPAMDEGVRSALFVNLLTEDNLPYYFNDIERMFGNDGAWGTWVRRWTAEEGRHSIVIRDYLTVTRQVDPIALERGRMAQVSGGVVPHPATVADGLAYLAMQELATRIAHHNTAKALTDKAGYEIMKRVAADENLHYLFYRDIATTCLELDPSGTVKAIERQVLGFDMPGTGIPNFTRHARAIARAGIYDMVIHYETILVPLIRRQWRLSELEGLDAEASAAVERLERYMARLAKVTERMKDRAASRGADAEQSSAESVGALAG